MSPRIAATPLDGPHLFNLADRAESLDGATGVVCSANNVSAVIVVDGREVEIEQGDRSWSATKRSGLAGGAAADAIERRRDLEDRLDELHREEERILDEQEKVLGELRDLRLICEGAAA